MRIQRAVLLLTGLCLTSLASAQEAQKIVNLSRSQAAAFLVALEKAKQEGEGISKCRYILDESKDSIEVSFLDATEVRDKFQVGTASEYCGFTYVIDSTDYRINRKYFHR